MEINNYFLDTNLQFYRYLQKITQKSDKRKAKKKGLKEKKNVSNVIKGKSKLYNFMYNENILNKSIIEQKSRSCLSKTNH